MRTRCTTSSSRRAELLALALVASGCGRLSFDALPDGDAGVGDDGSVAAGPCNRISNLVDSFDGLAFDPVWDGSYADVGTSLGLGGGELRLIPATNAPGYAGLASYRYYDLRGTRFSAEILETPTNGATGGMHLAMDPFGLSVTQTGGSLFAAYRDETSFIIIGSITYVPDTHRFWGISERDGIVYWETSQDGVTFVPFQMRAVTELPFAITHLRGSLYAGSDVAVAAPGRLRAGSVGTPGTAGVACPSSDLVDTFDGDLALRWLNSRDDACCTLTAASGTITEQSDGTYGFTALRSSSGYDLRGREVHAELVAPSSVVDYSQSLIASQDFNNRVVLAYTGGVWDTYEVVGGTGTDHIVSYMSGERWLRISEAGGTYTTSVSADRQTWRTLYSGPTQFGFDNVTFELQLGNPDMAMTLAAGTTVWDNFNVP